MAIVARRSTLNITHDHITESQTVLLRRIFFLFHVICVTKVRVVGSLRTIHGGVVPPWVDLALRHTRHLLLSTATCLCLGVHVLLVLPFCVEHKQATTVPLHGGCSAC